MIVAIPQTVPIAFGNIAIGGPETTFSKLESIHAQLGIWGSHAAMDRARRKLFPVRVAPTAVAPDASSGILEASANDGVTMEIFAVAAAEHAPARPADRPGIG